MTASLRLVAPAALALLATGCATLNPPPPVDLLPTAPPPVAATPRPTGPATGSLFHAASYRPAFEDRRARMVGDIVTIQIVEQVTAKQNSTSSIDRSANTSAGISAFPFIGAGKLGKLDLGAKSANQFSGKGGTESSNTFTGTITATVIEVLPNGHLVVAGEKQIGVNENVDVLRFSGTVDPRSLQPGSVVASTQVANARLQSRGRGAQSEAQAMGWLSRAFNSVAPF
ncbi:flagellar basal body L-ring protein FlgH [Alicycliphilus denitrificans]|uniref:Flagellar L-ring protein n=2 Tax=Alicycliphilus denitrificans TaxID=179636 RepID=F4G6T3_ALIDK|nr:flagellar basal body L-ring protein FlgH [Alicycliphilus denitrificans]GAO21367.1 flagellar L-ring protein [Alicycliphilus sp. B1]ADV01592.1 flagellar L-ring protein [Alicycliphilus denitrificans BC]AEB86545.1 flagellar L-ring protein [Alicycliphilus denitrificans K601]QKD45647.1 flagellar basal body L-ring protein FlgH [Alicycliphilus denitrificans]GAO25158.1 flagellar L-ring protein [Alicycliphilus sp. B1]